VPREGGALFGMSATPPRAFVGFPPPPPPPHDMMLCRVAAPRRAWPRVQYIWAPPSSSPFSTCVWPRRDTPRATQRTHCIPDVCHGFALRGSDGAANVVGRTGGLSERRRAGIDDGVAIGAQHGGHRP